VTDNLDSEVAAKSAVLAKIGKTHGVKGWVRIISFTSPVENIFDYSSFIATRDGETRTVDIDQYKDQTAGILGHIKGVDTPEQAKQLAGMTLSVSVAELPQLTADEVYWYQLEGLAVINQNDQLLGVVNSLIETGSNDVLIVKPSEDSIDDRERLIPFRRGATVSEVNIAAGTLRVIWDAEYLE
jgi:16S rRNA processing protein RimM